jgi:hypothetical protein
MLGNDQLKLVAQQLDREADERIGAERDDRFDRQQLWEVVRRASHAIEAVATIDGDGVEPADRRRRVRYIVSELESALEAARRAKVVLDWSSERVPDDY